MRNIFLIVIGVFLLQSCSNIRLSNNVVRDDVYYTPQEPVVVDEYYYDLPQNNYYDILQYDQVYYNRLRFGLGVYPSWNWQPNWGFWVWNDPFYYNRWSSANWTWYRYNWWWGANFWGYNNYWGANCWGPYQPYPNYWGQYPNTYGNRTYYGHRSSISSMGSQRASPNSRLNTNNISLSRPLEINRNVQTPTRQITRETNRSYYKPQSTIPSVPTRSQQYTRPPATVRPTTTPRTNPTLSPTRTDPRTTAPVRTQPKPSPAPTRTSPRISK